jgi:hypothetical protein
VELLPPAPAELGEVEPFPPAPLCVDREVAALAELEGFEPFVGVSVYVTPLDDAPWAKLVLLSLIVAFEAELAMLDALAGEAPPDSKPPGAALLPQAATHHNAATHSGGRCSIMYFLQMRTAGSRPATAESNPVMAGSCLGYGPAMAG